MGIRSEGFCSGDVQYCSSFQARGPEEEKRKRRTIVTPDERVSVLVCYSPVHMLLRLLKSDVHVSVETGQNPCAQNAISILIRKDGGE